MNHHAAADALRAKKHVRGAVPGSPIQRRS